MTPHEGGPSDEGIDLDLSRISDDVKVEGIAPDEVRDAYMHRPVEQLADRRIGGAGQGSRIDGIPLSRR